MRQASTFTVDCRGRVARVEVVGEGPDVVFSGTAAPIMWSRPAARALAGHGFRVVNFDYGSDCDDPLGRSALDQVEDVVDVMNVLDVAEASLVGLSRGAMTAFGVAADHPDRVSSLVLAFPVAGFADTIGVHLPDPEPEPGEDPDAFMRRFLGTVFSEDFLSTHLDEAVKLAGASPGEVTRLDRDEETPFPEGMTVDCPTLIIEGGADRVVTAEHPARYLRALPTAQHRLVPEAAHAWLREQPEEFALMLAGFLRPGWVGSRRTESPEEAGWDHSPPV